MNFKTTTLNPFGLLIEPNHTKDHILDLSVDLLREFVYQYRLIVLRGFHSFKNPEDFPNYCALWGVVSIWPFGKVLELIQQKNPTDHIFDNNYVPLHWDGMYRPQVPEFQIFHCVNAPNHDQGGRTTFSNTASAIQGAETSVCELWSRVTGVYSRKTEFYNSQTIAPVITTHPVRGFPVIRYCEPPQKNDEHFINHPTIEFKGISDSELSHFYHTLHQALYASENFYAHSWQTNDIVISDNHTLLHGREGFTDNAPRHLRRVHVLGNPPLENPHLVSHK